MSSTNSPPPKPLITISPCRTPDSIEQVRTLFRAYYNTNGIGQSLAIQRFEQELATLPSYFVPPGGDLLLAVDAEGSGVGCIAIRPLPAGCALASVEKPFVGAVGKGNLNSPDTTDAESLPLKICEMKRLYVLSSTRGLGIGRKLVEAALQRAKELGYEEVRLDTLPWMKEAIKLYAEFGFREIEAYHERWGADNEELLFFAKSL